MEGSSPRPKRVGIEVPLLRCATAQRGVFDAHYSPQERPQHSRLAIGGEMSHALELDRSTLTATSGRNRSADGPIQQTPAQALRGTTLDLTVTTVRHFLH